MELLGYLLRSGKYGTFSSGISSERVFEIFNDIRSAAWHNVRWDYSSGDSKKLVSLCDLVVYIWSFVPNLITSPF